MADTCIVDEGAAHEATLKMGGLQVDHDKVTQTSDRHNSESDVSLADTPRAELREDWEFVREDLLAGDQSIVGRYGNFIRDQNSIERFLISCKGNRSAAVNMILTHLKWRTEYGLDKICEEDFEDMKAVGELYWAGRDSHGLPCLTWRVSLHDASRTSAERFVRFFVYTIEAEMRSSKDYPNSKFNIFLDIDNVGAGNMDTAVAGLLQPLLAANYPKVRHTLFVFPISWWAQMFWGTCLQPLLRVLQPDIDIHVLLAELLCSQQDKLCILKGAFLEKLKDRVPHEEVEVRLGGSLKLEERTPLQPLPYPYTS